MKLAEIANSIAEAGLYLGAIKLSPTKPFTWASGYQMPVYNDNRKLLGKAEYRALVAEGFMRLIEEHSLQFDVVAGIATAGIPHATTLADRLGLPLAYVRADAKGHGLGRRVEGLLQEDQEVLLIEDVVSTGRSSVSAMKALRDEGSSVHTCLAIFSYGFADAESLFQSAGSRFFPILTWDVVLEVALSRSVISKDDLELLEAWKRDPFGWGSAQGFPPQNRA